MQWDLTEWPIPKIKAWFRGLVVAYVLFVVGSWYLPADTFLARRPEGAFYDYFAFRSMAIAPGWLQWSSELGWLVLAFDVLAIIGLLLVHSWGRKLFTIVYFTVLVSSAFTGIATTGGLKSLFAGLASLTAGVILCLAHTSPVRDIMSPDWDEPTE